ncbi:hypothetical protein L218DRAFT_1061821 [Marasmius fiardii PR-910]|nr:hypothetical protein L218DRAFT_1061821 [Marasmius fiardii PR-910]
MGEITPSVIPTDSVICVISTACVQALENKKTVACVQARNASESLCSGSEDVEREYEYEPEIDYENAIDGGRQADLQFYQGTWTASSFRGEYRVAISPARPDIGIDSTNTGRNPKLLEARTIREKGINVMEMRSA